MEEKNPDGRTEYGDNASGLCCFDGDGISSYLYRTE